MFERERNHGYTREQNVKASHTMVEKNPCLKEQEMSLKCLDENCYDGDKCSKEFLNYKNCKKFWSYIFKDRKKRGIEPALPAANERDQVKAEYKHLMSWMNQ